MSAAGASVWSIVVVYNKLACMSILHPSFALENGRLYMCACASSHGCYRGVTHFTAASDRWHGHILAGDEEEAQLEFRIIDYGHARLAKKKALAKLPQAPGLELSYRK